MWFACELLFTSVRSGCQLPGLSVDKVSHWVLGIAEQAVQRNGERSFFLHMFEQSWPALHVPVDLAPDLGRGPSRFSNFNCPPFCFYTCFSYSSFLTHCLAVDMHWNLNFYCLLNVPLNCIFWDSKIIMLVFCQMSWNGHFFMHWLQVLSRHMY